jgi:hypothetical protein
VASSRSVPKKTDDADKKFHLDRRAGSIADAGKGAADDLLTSCEMAVWFGVTEQWLILGRRRGYGPPVSQPFPEVIRYRRGDAIKWLRERARMAANEYA